MPSWLEVIGAVIGAVFGVGVAWASLKEKVKAALIRAETALQQSDTALKKNSELELALANERTERTKVEWQLKSLEREAELREEFRQQNDILAIQTSYLDAIAKRTGSTPMMPAARPQTPREGTQAPSPIPPPPMRAKLPSRGRFGAE